MDTITNIRISAYCAASVAFDQKQNIYDGLKPLVKTAIVELAKEGERHKYMFNELRNKINSLFPVNINSAMLNKLLSSLKKDGTISDYKVRNSVVVDNIDDLSNEVVNNDYELQNFFEGFCSYLRQKGRQPEIEKIQEEICNLIFSRSTDLAEFMNNKWYLASPSQVDSWKFALTTVDFRIKQMNERIEESKKLASGEIKPEVKKSDEEAVELMRSVLGLTTTISNVNLPNRGQISWLPEGSIVETNAVFSNDRVVPVTTKPLPVAVQSLVRRCSDNIDILYEGIKKRDKKIIFESFVNQPLCSSLTLDEARSLFDEMYEKNLRFFQKNN